MCKINFKKVEPPKALPQVTDLKAQHVQASFPGFDDVEFAQNFLRTPDKSFALNPFQFNFEIDNEAQAVKNEFPLDLSLEIGYPTKMILEEEHLPQITGVQVNMEDLPNVDVENSIQYGDTSSNEVFESKSPSGYYQEYLSSQEGSPSSPLSSPSSGQSSPPYSAPFLPTQTPNLKRPVECSAANATKKRAPTKVEPVTEVETKPTVPPPKKKSQARNPKISEEKRERNRLAAEKYRKKGRDTIATLERACHQLNAENTQLKDKSQMLEQQVQQLKTLLLQYGVSKELLDAVGLSL